MDPGLRKPKELQTEKTGKARKGPSKKPKEVCRPRNRKGQERPFERERTEEAEKAKKTPPPIHYDFLIKTCTFGRFLASGSPEPFLGPPEKSLAPLETNGQQLSEHAK